MRFVFTISLALSLISVSCTQEKYPETFTNKLICIEDLTGKYGIWDGNFGDIVAYDITSGDKFVLTNDKYYDEEPSYSTSLNKILFESKREGIYGSEGLSAETNLFILDVANKSIELVDDKNFKKRIDSKKWNELNTPIFSNSGKKFAALITGVKNATRDRIAIYNFETDSIYIHPKEYRTIMNLVWSDDDKNIFFDYEAENPSKNGRDDPFVNHGIGILDLSNKSDSTILIIDKMSAYLGDFLNGNIVYIKNALPFKGTLEIYNIKHSKIIFLKPINELGFQEIKSPLFKDESSLFFIGNIHQIKNQFDEDIYEMDISTLELQKISNTNNIKYSLHDCR